MSKMFNIMARKNQQGAVLVVALIMLLLLTMIGVAGIRETQLQEKMAGGAQDRELALQAAEAALRAGETDAKSIASGVCVAPCSTEAETGYVDYDVSEKSGLQRGGITEVAYWQSYAWANAVPYTGTLSAAVSTPPRYVIEKLPTSYSAIPGTINGNASSGVGAKTITDFLITARGTGTTSDSVVILQSMYRYISPPDPDPDP